MKTRIKFVDFRVQRIVEGEVQILSLGGYMGNIEFREVDKTLSRLLEKRDARVILDLTTLTFTTSVSLARFLACAQGFRRRGGELKLVGLSQQLSRLAQLAGFHEKKDFEPDVATALWKLSHLPEALKRSEAKKK